MQNKHPSNRRDIAQVLSDACQQIDLVYRRSFWIMLFLLIILYYNKSATQMTIVPDAKCVATTLPEDVQAVLMKVSGCHLSEVKHLLVPCCVIERNPDNIGLDTVLEYVRRHYSQYFRRRISDIENELAFASHSDSDHSIS